MKTELVDKQTEKEVGEALQNIKDGKCVTTSNRMEMEDYLCSDDE